jgi:hypothetical protein
VYEYDGTLEDDGRLVTDENELLDDGLDEDGLDEDGLDDWSFFLSFLSSSLHFLN